MTATATRPAEPAASLRIAQLSRGDRVTLCAAFGDVPVLITDVDPGDATYITEGFALSLDQAGFQVSITQSAIRNGLYQLRPGWPA